MSAFDDYLKAPVAPAAQGGASFDSYLGASAPVPASAAGGAGAVAPQAAAGQNVNLPPIPQSGGGSFLSNILGIGNAQMPSLNTQPAPLGGFLTGVGDAAKGTTEGIVNALSWAADKIAPNSQFSQQARAAIPQIQNSISQQNSAYEAQRAAQGKSGIDIGRIAGNTLGTAPAMLIGPEYAGLGLLGKVGLGAAQGAAGASMLPVENPGDNFWTQKAQQAGVGAGLGAATPLVAAGAKALGKGLWNVVQPVVQPGKFVGQGLANAMDPVEAAAAASNIRNAPTFVPGSIPTTAQAAQTPVMVQTEKAAANIPAFKSAAIQRASDNNIARWGVLNGVAQDDAALQAAQATRNVASAPLYAAAHAASAPADSTLFGLMQRPSVQSAMQDAEKLAQDEGTSLQWPTAKNPTINGQALDYLGRAMNDQIGNAQRSGSSQLMRAVTKNQEAIDQWGQANIPAIAAARQAYAAGSVPINTMEVGQQIANKLGTKGMIPGIGGGVAELQLNPYRTALTQAMNSGNAAQFGIDTGALGALQGVGQDLQRQSLSNSIKFPGSDTAYNLAANGWLARQLYGPTFGGSTALGRTIAGVGTAMAGHPWAGAGLASGMGKIGTTVGNRLQDRLSGLLLDPNSVLPYLDARAAASAQGVPGPLMQGLLNYGRPAAVQGLLGGLQNSGNK